MKLLVITPMYEIVGRPDLTYDTAAIHYLLKYHPADTEVLVIYTYFSSVREIGRYASPEARRHYREHTCYVCDGIPVELIETQLLMKRFPLSPYQCRRLTGEILNVLKKRGFAPDKIVCHLPSYRSVQFIDKIPAPEKIAVLHNSDVRRLRQDPDYRKLLEHRFQRCYARSRSVYREFFGLKNLCPEILSSGVILPQNEGERCWDFSSGRTVKLLYVGKLIKRKNVDLILRAMAALPGRHSLQLTVLGGGKELPRLQALAEQLGISPQVVFLPAVPHAQVFAHMAQADIFVMPSVNETLGLVYLEAMAMGCLTIGTKGEGIDGILTDGVNGFLTEPTAQALTETLERIFALSQDGRSACAKGALETARAHEESKMGAFYFRTIQGNTPRLACNDPAL